MDNMKLHFDVDGEDFTRAGEASGETKRVLKGLGFDANVIRNVSIAMYEGEINMVIHAGGGEIDVEISPECISMGGRGRTAGDIHPCGAVVGPLPVRHAGGLFDRAR